MTSSVMQVLLMILIDAVSACTRPGRAGRIVCVSRRSSLPLQAVAWLLSSLLVHIGLHELAVWVWRQLVVSWLLFIEGCVAAEWSDRSFVVSFCLSLQMFCSVFTPTRPSVSW